jgi:hypothetical protein
VNPALDLGDLDALIAELTVDAYGDEEQLTGLLVGAEDGLAAGEAATVVGVRVNITAVTAGPDVRRGLIAVCEGGGKRHEISLADVRFDPGSELGRVAAAYRRWLGCDPFPQHVASP